ncbi:hypothetical protein [Luteipulveratus mongoliensis]|nr:hypothetical protein [Luteipulveratus mongoliensis]
MTSGNKAAWNIGGAVVGILLAGLSILGLIQSQNSIKQPQTYNNVISYDS